MFKPNTLVVLGAGSSFEAGLPLGYDLKDKISALTEFKFEQGTVVSGDRHFIAELHRFDEFRTRDGPQKIVLACRKISNGIGFVSSVDNFLEIHAADSDVQRCAKAAIAYLISKGEKSSRLYVDHSNIYNRLSAASLKETWYQELAHILFERVDSDRLSDAFDRVKFVSFNYDRCLEWFLFQSLISIYAIDASRACEVLKRVTILHPYGEIGAPQWLGGRSDFFGCDISGSVVQASKRLLIYTEGSPPEIVNEVRDVVQAAETIVFLGFGFHAQNMELLMPQAVNENCKVANVYGTGFGMSDNDVAATSDLIGNAFLTNAGRTNMHRPAVNLVDLSCCHFLRRYKRTLSI